MTKLWEAGNAGLAKVAFLILIGAALAGGTLVGKPSKRTRLCAVGLWQYHGRNEIWVALAILTVTAGIGYVTLRLMGRLLDSPEGIGRLWARLRGRVLAMRRRKGLWSCAWVAMKRH